MIMHFRPALLALLAAAVTSQAAAQQPPSSGEAFKAILGKWQLSNAENDRSCAVTFRPDPNGSMFKLEIDKTCLPSMPELKDVVAWTIGGLDIVRLLDARGQAVLEFTEVESGIYEAQRPGEGVFIMQSAAAAASEPGLSVEEMAGDWGVVRGSGKMVCTITLTSNSIGQDNFGLKLKPGCDALVARFGPASWYMDRGELVLKSKGGQFWRFEENDPANWSRVPEGREPINLVRQGR